MVIPQLWDEVEASSSIAVIVLLLDHLFPPMTPAVFDEKAGKL